MSHTLFLRWQLSPYCITTSKAPWWDEHVLPAMKFLGPVPHGRSANTGEPSDWKPDQYGYTDFDDYHLAIYGA